MKKTLLFACTIVSLSTISHAQITKGSVLLGGNIGFSKGRTATEGNDSKSNNTSIYPSVGVAVKENWIIGIGAGFSNYKEDPTPYYSAKRKGESYSGGLYVRRYSSLGKNFYLYGHGSINYNKTNQSENNSINYENYYNSKGVNLSIAPGIAYAVNKRFHLEASLSDLITAGYSTWRRRNITQSGGIISSSNTEGKNFGLGANLNPASQLNIGFRFVLGK